MDFFSLPDVIIREVMKYVPIKDRLSLRLTCRAFEELVADTHLGHFEQGHILQWPHECNFSIRLGPTSLKASYLAGDGLHQFLRTRHRLFSGVSIGTLSMHITDQAFALDFVRDFARNFHAKVLRLTVYIQTQLESARHLISYFPRSDCVLELWFLPDIDILLSLPPLKEVKIPHDQVSTDMFFKLLNVYPSLDLGRRAVTLTQSDWRRAMQIVSASTSEKKLIFPMVADTMVKHLRSFGMSEKSQVGDRSGEFEVCRVPDATCECVQFRYEICWVLCPGNVWSTEDGIATVLMANSENHTPIWCEDADL